jgi:hypothetical protein
MYIVCIIYTLYNTYNIHGNSNMVIVWNTKTLIIISQPYRPPRPVTGIVLLYIYISVCVCVGVCEGLPGFSFILIFPINILNLPTLLLHTKIRGHIVPIISKVLQTVPDLASKKPHRFFFETPFYLQSVYINSGNGCEDWVLWLGEAH